jgi:hypothetical protein
MTPNQLKIFIEEIRKNNDSIENIILKAYHFGYAEKNDSHGQYVVEKTQPPFLWVLVYKNNGKRQISISFDGPISPHYIKMGRVE